MSNLDVNGDAVFSGQINIDGGTEMNSDLEVIGNTILRNSLTVENFSRTRLTGPLILCRWI